MTNILAIVKKEWRGYFASPIGYVVLGMYALVFGLFYAVGLYFFLQQSMAGPQMGGGPLNVNQMLIRYVFQNSSIVMVFVVPLITMRTYAEEKRLGTVELLMTSPITDFQILAGKFLGAMSLYAAMLGLTVIHIGLLFFYGNPEWKPILTGYLGLLLLGSCIVSIGLFFSSLTKNQIVAGHADGRGRAAAVAARLDRRAHGAHGRARRQLRLAEFAPRRLRPRRRRHAARDLLPERDHLRPVPHGQVGRRRAVAGVTR